MPIFILIGIPFGFVVFCVVGLPLYGVAWLHDEVYLKAKEAKPIGAISAMIRDLKNKTCTRVEIE